MKQKSKFSWADIMVIFLLLAILYAAAELGSGMEVPFSAVQQPKINLILYGFPIMQGVRCFECLSHLQRHLYSHLCTAVLQPIAKGLKKS
jgi:hypothetical protein